MVKSEASQVAAPNNASALPISAVVVSFRKVAALTAWDPSQIPTAFAATNVTATMRIMAIAMIKTCSTDPTAVIVSRKGNSLAQGTNLDLCETALSRAAADKHVARWRPPSDFRTTAVEPASAALA